jgi:hypothetical protein
LPRKNLPPDRRRTFTAFVLAASVIAALFVVSRCSLNDADKGVPPENRVNLNPLGP